MMLFTSALLGLFAASAHALPSPNSQTRDTEPVNDFSCRSNKNPVILLHGLADNKKALSSLQAHLNTKGLCAFSMTYGAHKLFPLVGGVKSMADSAKEIASFIDEVSSKTGAPKVDIVGHSEGGVMTLYVPLTQSGTASKIERTVALGPAVHGAKYYGLTDLVWLGGDVTASMVEKVLRTFGAPAMAEMATGGAVHETFQQATGKIVQPGVKASIVMSRHDILVKPETSVVNEEGVRNLYVQDYCPQDRVGHSGLATDKSVWGIVENELLEKYDEEVTTCEAGKPI